MLRRIYIDNFRCMVNFELRVGPMNLLLGPNGAGKSTVLETLEAVAAFVRGEGDTGQLFPTRTLTRWGIRNLQTFEIDIEGKEGLFSYRLEVEHERDRKLCRVRGESLSMDGKPLYSSDGAHARLYRDDFSEGPEVLCDWSRSGLGIVQPRHDNTLLTWFKSRLANVWVIRLNPFDMATRSEREQSRPDRGLANFASWFRHLSQEEQAQIFELTSKLKESLEGFDSFRLVQEGENARSLLTRFEVEAGNGHKPRGTVEFRFDELSDGQRALIALHTLLLVSPVEGKTLCIDEPENFLALPEIQPWLCDLTEQTEDGACQAILVSHHPELIDMLAVGSGTWLERRQAGPVRVKPIAGDDESGLPVSELVARGWLHG